MRADSDVEEIEDEYKRIVKGVIGTRARVRWQRLTADRSEGGFGLIDLKEWSTQMKKGWLNYLVRATEEGGDTVAVEWFNRWADRTQKRALTATGPLMSWNGMAGECREWQFIAEAMGNVKFYSRVIGKANMWTWNDRVGEEVMIREADSGSDICAGEDTEMATCDIVIPEESEGDRLRRTYKWKYGDREVRRTMEGTRDWKMIRSSPWTGAQKRWKEEGYDWKTEWDKIREDKLTCGKIKEWWLDALNVNLRVRCKTDECRVCGKEVGSKHFISDCEGLDLIRRTQTGISAWDSSWVLWTWHCLGRGEGERAMKKRMREKERAGIG